MGKVLSLQRLSAAAVEKLHGRKWDEDKVGETLERWEEGSKGGDLDKAWQGLHFLLTGTADGGKEPECFLLKGGRDLAAFDLGAGPAHTLNPEQVRSFAVCLAKHTRDTLRARYDTKRMIALDVYLAETIDAEGDEGFEYLFESFAALKRIVDDARAAGEGLVVYFS